ncbi:MAG: autotransporter outer membrane beta-barrel domain-containing protein, partial [Pseudomonadota bacterium]
AEIVDATIRNGGSIISAQGDGARLASTGQGGQTTAKIVIEQGGTLQGAGYGYNEVLTGNNDLDIAATLDVAGTLTGTTGAANMGAGDDRFIVRQTATINGTVEGGTGSDTLQLDFAAAGTLDATLLGTQFTGFEQFEKTGQGAATFTGTTTVAGDASVLDGLAVFNGSLANMNVTAQNGGSIGGSGTIGNLILASGGRLAPGNSIGTLNVTDATLGAGSVYDVEVAADGTSDLLLASGTVTLQGGTVNAIEVSPSTSYTEGQKFTIITANGGLNGQFSGVGSTSGVVSYALSYDANNVFLSRSAADFTVGATSFNTTQIASVLNTADFGSDPAVSSSLLGLDRDQLPGVLNALTGEVHAEVAAGASSSAGAFNALLSAVAAGQGGSAGVSVATLSVPVPGLQTLATGGSVEIDAGRYGADLAPAPLTSFGPTVWLGALGNYADVDGDGNAAGYDVATYGLAGGIEGDYDGIARYGLAIGYTSGNLDVDDRAQDTDIRTLHVGVYGSAGAGRMESGLGLRGSASYAHHWVDTSRNIAFGTINRTASADYDGHTISADLEARYTFMFDTASFGPTAFSPFIRGQFGRTDLGSFSESGAGLLNLSGSGSDFIASSVALGVAVAGDYDLGSFTWRPSLSVAYERLTGDNASTANLNLAGAPTAFAVSGVSENRNRLRLGSVSEFVLSDQARLTVATDGIYSQDRRDVSVKAGLKFNF